MSIELIKEIIGKLTISDVEVGVIYIVILLGIIFCIAIPLLLILFVARRAIYHAKKTDSLSERYIKRRIVCPYCRTMIYNTSILVCPNCGGSLFEGKDIEIDYNIF